MKTTSEYGAALLETMGSDLSVVNAARVSFDKESDWVQQGYLPGDGGKLDGVERPAKYNPYEDYPLSFDENSVELTGFILSEKDQKLVHYLAKEGHWSPFAHAFLKFRVKAPIFVARQLQKHQVGLSWNEVSRRYVDSEPEFYVPQEWRKRADDKKQGSSEETIGTPDVIDNGGDRWSYLDLMAISHRFYQDLLDHSCAPEQARMVLPQSTMTEWIWSGSLYAFARVCKERLHPSAQRETRWVAEDISQALATHFPVSWQALASDLASFGLKDSINVS